MKYTWSKYPKNITVRIIFYQEKLFSFIFSEAVSLLRLVIFGNIYENEVPESTEAQRLTSIIEDGLKTSNLS